MSLAQLSPNLFYSKFKLNATYNGKKLFDIFDMISAASLSALVLDLLLMETAISSSARIVEDQKIVFFLFNLPLSFIYQFLIVLEL